MDGLRYQYPEVQFYVPELVLESPDDKNKKKMFNTYFKLNICHLYLPFQKQCGVHLTMESQQL
jgi:hypothetical protein